MTDLKEALQEIRPMSLKADAKMSANGLLHIGYALDTGANYESIQRVYSPKGKVPTLTAVCGGYQEAKVQLTEDTYRRLYAIEYERAMGLPDNYTSSLSRSRRYKVVGNGWERRTVEDIFKQGSFKEPLTVLSCFGGIECGKIALDNVYKIEKYYSSEIDPYPIGVVRLQHPEVNHVGSILNWRSWDINWSSVNLLIGGSPCQGFSRAGKLHGTSAILNKVKVIVTSLEQYEKLKQEGAIFLSQSALFWEFVAILKHVQSVNPDVKYLLENVVMDTAYREMIDRELGCLGVQINSNLYSPQSRDRIYWFNWDYAVPIKISKLNLSDIMV